DLYTDIRETEFIEGPEVDFKLPFRTVSQDGFMYNTTPLADSKLEWLRRNSVFARWLFNRLVKVGYQSWFEFRSGEGRQAIVPNSVNPPSLDRGQDTPEARLSFHYLKLIEKACRARNPNCTFHVLLIPQDFLVYDLPNPHSNLAPADAKLVR